MSPHSLNITTLSKLVRDFNINQLRNQETHFLRCVFSEILFLIESKRPKLYDFFKNRLKLGTF